MTAIEINPGVLYRELDGESVLLELGTGRYFGLDEVGSRIWSLIVEHRCLEGVLDGLLTEYDAPVDRLRGDVSSFVEVLREQGLLEIGHS